MSLSESTPQQLQMLSLQGTVKFTQYHRGKQITQRTARHRVYDYFCIVQFFLPVLFSSFFFLQAYIRQIDPIRGQTKCNSEEVYEKAEIKEAWNLTGNRETEASPWRGGSSVSPWWLDLYLCRLEKAYDCVPRGVLWRCFEYYINISNIVIIVILLGTELGSHCRQSVRLIPSGCWHLFYHRFC